VTDPAQPRPVPGPPRLLPGPLTRPAPDAGAPESRAPESRAPEASGPAAVGVAPFADLASRPVADHVAVYEAEHERLQRELSTIDQL
jgi:hypothetical protein